MTTQNQAFDVKKISEPGFYEENRLPACADLVLRRPDLSCHFRNGRISLDGLWYVRADHNPDSAPEDFFEEGKDIRSWDVVPVPGHLELAGLSRPQYTNTIYPWDGHEELEKGQAPHIDNTTASYVRFFTFPEELLGEEVRICFQGVESAYALWLNGSYIGYAEDSFLPSEFDLTPYLRAGENKLAVRVYRWSSGAWFEDQDMFRFSGIFREVYLRLIPKVHAEDFSFRAEVAEDLQRAELRFGLLLKGKPHKILTRLLNPAGECLSEFEPEAAGDRAEWTMTIEHPFLWDENCPALYRFECELYDENGCCESFAESLAVRRFEIKDGLMHLNGKPIFFYGVNRHDMTPWQGRVPDFDQIEADIREMKRHHVNMLRLSHYPNHPDLYRLCDLYGLYVVDECNCETHGIWNMITEKRLTPEEAIPGNYEDWSAAYLSRVKRMYARDKNRGSILFWSLGNESYGGTAFTRAADWLRAQDPTRLVHYEGVSHDLRYPEASDVYSQMYTPAAELADFIEKHTDKPVMLCEFAHAMGNSFGAVHKYLECAEAHPRFQGMLIWDYVDQAIWSEKNGKEYLAYGGDFGDFPHDLNFCSNGIMFADRGVNPKLSAMAAVYTPFTLIPDAEGLIIRPRRAFADHGKLLLSCRILCNGEKISETNQELGCLHFEELEEQRPNHIFKDFRLAWAGEFKELLSEVIRKVHGTREWLLDITLKTADIRPYAEAGLELARVQALLGRQEMRVLDTHSVHSEAASSPAAVKADPILLPGPKVTEDLRKAFRIADQGDTIGIHGMGFSVFFSRAMGGLVDYRWCGRSMFEQRPRPAFWRAQTDNDRGCQMAFRHAAWKAADHYLKAEGCKLHRFEDRAEVVFTYKLPEPVNQSLDLLYRVHADGLVEVESDLKLSGKLPAPPLFGMSFALPLAYHEAAYYGLGPEENYCDRMNNTYLGLYRFDVRDNLTPYILPQEAGNRCGVRRAEVTDRRGMGLCFYPGGGEFSALPYRPDEIEACMHPEELPEPQRIIVRICGKQMGVGGDNSWGAQTHPEYCLSPEDLSLRFAFKGRAGRR